MTAREGRTTTAKKPLHMGQIAVRAEKGRRRVVGQRKTVKLVTMMHRVGNFSGNNNCTCFDIPFVENRRISTLDNGFIASPLFVNVSLPMCSTAAGVVDVVGLWLSLLQRKEEYIL